MITVVSEQLKVKGELGNLKCAWAIDSGQVHLEEEGYHRTMVLEMSDWPFESDLSEMQKNGVRGRVVVGDSNENTLTIYQLTAKGVFRIEGKVIAKPGSFREKL